MCIIVSCRVDWCSHTYMCFFNDTATTEIDTYVHTLSLHGALPSSPPGCHPADNLLGFSGAGLQGSIAQAAYATAKGGIAALTFVQAGELGRSEEHTSELQSLMRTSYAVLCLHKKTT